MNADNSNPVAPSHRQLMAAWPKLTELASDMTEDYKKVHKWSERNFIPAEYWVNFVSAAQHRGYSVNFETLARACAIEKTLEFEKKRPSV